LNAIIFPLLFSIRVRGRLNGFSPFPGALRYNTIVSAARDAKRRRFEKTALAALKAPVPAGHNSITVHSGRVKRGKPSVGRKRETIAPHSKKGNTGTSMFRKSLLAAVIIALTPIAALAQNGQGRGPAPVTGIHRAADTHHHGKPMIRKIHKSPHHRIMKHQLHRKMHLPLKP
jgi:hypothetical protein